MSDTAAVDVLTISERVELEALRDAFVGLAWARMQERFHEFDAIKDDKCPGCGGRVVCEETPNSVRLRAVK